MDLNDVIFPAIVIAFLILSLGIHEAAHAWSAYKLGDDTAKREGRMTLNPIPHIDPMWTIVMPVLLWISTNGAFVFGGAKPVPVVARRLRNPSRDMMLTALAGPASNVLLVIFFVVVIKVVSLLGVYEPGAMIYRALYYAAVLNAFLAVFNMIPMPPLDGSRVVMHFLPNSMKPGYARIEQFGIILIIAMFWGVPGFGNTLGVMGESIVEFFYKITGGPWA